ncbi:lyase family protein [uncultured Parasutterella sp.]|jgi:Aspartate ammonia-lyase|uniref:lyase family protein n=2 Tax=uncultured Parasutterella sp. TaxID=1263098 RepID=UPI002597FE4D|nr:lyase family protein [uncultured Parasutterella sp.]
MSNLTPSFTRRSLFDFPQLLKAYGEIKKASAIANLKIGEIDEASVEKIISLCDELICCPSKPEFRQIKAWAVDGLSFNEAVNAYLAEKSGLSADLVNNCQSAEDVLNTAQNIAIFRQINDSKKGIEFLLQTLRDKAVEFEDMLHVGRQHMQEALPVTWGAVFGAMYLRLRRSYEELKRAQQGFLTVNLGVTPIDQFTVSKPGFASNAVNELRKITGLDLHGPETSDEVVASSAALEVLEGNDRYVYLISCLRAIALNMARIGNDLYLYSSGPRCGIGELSLPAIAPGSTIMPGKINPSMPELMLQIFHQTMGTDQFVMFSAIEEDIDLGASLSNAYFAASEVIEIIGRGCERFVVKCVSGVSVKEAQCEEHLINSASLIALVRARFGEETASLVREMSEREQISISEAAERLNIASAEEIHDLFNLSRFKDPEALKEYFGKY